MITIIDKSILYCSSCTNFQFFFFRKYLIALNSEHNSEYILFQSIIFIDEFITINNYYITTLIDEQIYYFIPKIIKKYNRFLNCSSV